MAPAAFLVTAIWMRPFQRCVITTSPVLVTLAGATVPPPVLLFEEDPLDELDELEEDDEEEEDDELDVDPPLALLVVLSVEPPEVFLVVFVAGAAAGLVEGAAFGAATGAAESTGAGVSGVATRLSVAACTPPS